MNFFNDDPFEDIFKEFLGQRQGQASNGSKPIIEGEEEERVIDFIETLDNIYLVFELPGYSEKDVNVKIRGKELDIESVKTECERENVQDYLTQKLCRGVFINKVLPNFLNLNKPKHTMRNGVLEITFNKK